MVGRSPQHEEHVLKGRCFRKVEATGLKGAKPCKMHWLKLRFPASELLTFEQMISARPRTLCSIPGLSTH